jgi:hypothetical protein
MVLEFAQKLRKSADTSARITGFEIRGAPKRGCRAAVPPKPPKYYDIRSFT